MTRIGSRLGSAVVRTVCAALMGLAAAGGCGGSSPSLPGSPTQPSPPGDPRVPPPTTVCQAPMRGPLLTPLAACCVSPNFVDWRIPLLRWERFPLLVSIERASLALVGDQADAYEQGIREGAVIWALATQGNIGRVNFAFDVEAEITIRLSEQDTDGDCVLFDVCSEGFFNPEVVEFDRVLRRGTIGLIRDQIRRQATSDVKGYIAKLVGHEMGHALGVRLHSDDPKDVMYGRTGRAAGTPYPWVSQRDLNTLGTAYCR